MTFRVCVGDVLKAGTQAIVLTMDGSGPRMEGNIARKFSAQWPEAWDAISDAVKLPAALGTVFAVELKSSCPFRWVLMASTLDHREALSSDQRANVVFRAFATCLHLCDRHKISSMATAVMTGGWRLTFEPALESMLGAYRSHSLIKRASLDLMVCTIDPDAAAKATKVIERQRVDGSL